MLYGIIAASNAQISNESASDSLSNISSQPPTRTPARPSSTRWPRGPLFSPA